VVVRDHSRNPKVDRSTTHRHRRSPVHLRPRLLDSRNSMRRARRSPTRLGRKSAASRSRRSMPHDHHNRVRRRRRAREQVIHRAYDRRQDIRSRSPRPRRSPNASAWKRNGANSFWPRGNCRWRWPFLKVASQPILFAIATVSARFARLMTALAQVFRRQQVRRLGRSVSPLRKCLASEAPNGLLRSEFLRLLMIADSSRVLRCHAGSTALDRRPFEFCESLTARNRQNSEKFPLRLPDGASSG